MLVDEDEKRKRGMYVYIEEIKTRGNGRRVFECVR